MARAIPVASGTANVQALTGAGTLTGAVATGASASTVRLRSGTTVTDPVVAILGIPAGGTVSAVLPAVDFSAGVFVERVGAVASELVLYIQ